MATQQQIAALYRQYLGREPDAGGLEFYLNPDFSLELIENDIANSAEARQFTASKQPQEDLTEFVFSRMTPAEMNAYSMLRDIGVNEMIPLTTIDGKSYFQNSDGSIVEIEPTGPIGANQTIYSAGGDVVEQANLPNYGARNPITDAAIAATGGLVLGPAVVGLSAPTAAALATGVPRYVETGSAEEAAKAAAIAAAAAFGAEKIGSLVQNTSFDVAFAADDAAKMANSGLNASEIAQNLSSYVDPATASRLANSAADQVFALANASDLAAQGLNANQIAGVLQASGVGANVAADLAENAINGVTTITAANIVPDLQFQPQTRGGIVGSTSGNVVNVPGAAIPASTTGAQLASTVAPGLLAQAAAPTSGVVSESVPVQNQGLLSEPTQATAPVGGAAGGLLGTTQAPETANVQDQQRQQVPVTGGSLTTQAGSAAGTTAGGVGGSIVGSITAPSGQQVEVVDRSTKAQTTAPVLPVTPAEPVTVEGRRVETADVAVPAGAAGAALGVSAPATPVTNNISLMDAATAALLISGIGSLLDQDGGGYTVDPNIANQIINAPRPTFGRGVGGYTPPSMFQIAPTNVYNPFATTAPFGAGRFGATVQPIALPGGLLGAR